VRVPNCQAVAFGDLLSRKRNLASRERKRPECRLRSLTLPARQCLCCTCDAWGVPAFRRLHILHFAVLPMTLDLLDREGIMLADQHDLRGNNAVNRERLQTLQTPTNRADR